MQALEIPETFADRLRAAKNLQKTFCRIAATCSAVVAFLAAGIACGQQPSSHAQTHAEPSTAARPSSPQEMRNELLQQIHYSKAKNSATRSRPFAAAQDVPSTFTRHETTDISGPSNPEVRLDQTDAPSAIQRIAFQSQADSTGIPQPPALSSEVQSAESLTPLRSIPEAISSSLPDSAETETTTANTAPELFLDLTQEAQTSDAARTPPVSIHRSEEVSMTSSPIQVLMRAVAWIVIALCLCSLTILGLRRWQRQRGLLPTTNSQSRVLETLSLGPGRTVSLIELAGYRALVASDTGGIRSLVLTPVSFHDELVQVEQSTDQHVSLTNQQ